MSNSGRTSTKGKSTNPKTSSKKDGKAAFIDVEDDGASDQVETANNMASTDEAPISQASLDNILDAIRTLKGDRNTRFNSVDSKLHIVQTSLANQAARIGDLEGCAADHKTYFTDLEKRYEESMEANKITRLKLADLKSRSRRSNIKITGLPEKVEKASPTQYVAEL